ncbi:MAG: PIN domain-containing protein [Acidobacteriota bacterium]
MKLFVDTSAWYALHDRSDRHHAAAVAFLDRWRTRPVRFFTSDYVADETITLLAMRAGRRQAVDFLDYLKVAGNLTFEFTSGRDFEAAASLFRVRSDKSWSFTDCISFVQMDRLDLADAFTFDRHFSQYGKNQHPAE